MNLNFFRSDEEDVSVSTDHLSKETISYKFYGVTSAAWQRSRRIYLVKKKKIVKKDFLLLLGGRERSYRTSSVKKVSKTKWGKMQGSRCVCVCDGTAGMFEREKLYFGIRLGVGRRRGRHIWLCPAQGAKKKKIFFFFF